MIKRLLIALGLLLAPLPAQAAFDSGDLICETTTTTGTGTVNLGGAVTNYVTFASQITSGDTVSYHIRASDGKLETGVGTFTDATPDTLTRTAFWSTDGSGAELTLPAGTHTVCVGPTTDRLVGADLSPQLGGDLDLNGNQIFDATITSEAQLDARENGFQVIGATDVDASIFGIYSDGDGAGGPTYYCQHDSASAADGDIACKLEVYAGADDEQVASIQLEVDDGSTGTEDTRWNFFVDVAGTEAQQMAIGNGVIIGSGSTFPGDGNLTFADAKGIFDGNGNEQLLFQQTASAVNYLEIENTATIGGSDLDSLAEVVTNSVKIRAAGDDANVGLHFLGKNASGNNFMPFVFDVEGAGNQDYPGLWLIGRHTGSGGPYFSLYHNSASPSTSDESGLFAQANNSVGAAHTFGTINFQYLDNTDGAEDGVIKLIPSIAGANAVALSVAEGVIIGSGTTFPGAGDLVVGDQLLVGTATPVNTVFGVPPVFAVEYAGSPDFNFVAYSTTDNQQAAIYLVKSSDATIGNQGLVVDNESLGTIWGAGSDGSNFEEAGYIGWAADGEWATAGDTTDSPGRFYVATTPNGSATPVQRMLVKNDGGVIIGNGTTSPGAEDLSLEGGDIEFGNAGTAGTDTTLDYLSAGNLSIEGLAVEKAGTQMIWVPASAMIARATSGADCGVTFDSGAADNTVRVCGFDTTADEWAFFTIGMPPRWNEGTITAQYVWTNTTAATASETVSIDISCAAVGDTEASNGALGTPVNVDDTNDTDLDFHTSAVSGAVTCANTPAANDTVIFGVMRDVSDDNLAGDMNLIGVRLFITTDTSNDG